jgi:hypothetical protein
MRTFAISLHSTLTQPKEGNDGQQTASLNNIMVVSALNMVAVFTGGAYNSQEDKLAFAIMNDIFLPTFKDINTYGVGFGVFFDLGI